MNCVYCGAPLMPGHTHCPNCGAQIGPMGYNQEFNGGYQYNSNPGPRPPNNTKVPGFVPLLIAIIPMIFCCNIFFAIIALILLSIMYHMFQQGNYLGYKRYKTACTVTIVVGYALYLMVIIFGIIPAIAVLLFPHAIDYLII